MSQHIDYTSRREDPIYIGFEDETAAKKKKKSNGFGAAAVFFGFLGLLTSVVTVPFMLATMYTNGIVERPPISVQLAAPFFFVGFAALAVIFGAIGIFKKPRFLAFVGGTIGLLVIGGAMGWSEYAVSNHRCHDQKLEKRMARQHTNQQINLAAKMIEKYREKNNAFPDGIQGNRIAIDVKDSWSNELRYEIANNGFTLRSAGPDKEFDTTDDISRTTFVQEVYTSVDSQ